MEKLRELLSQEAIEVRVRAGARKNALERIDGTIAYLAIAAPREGGKANRELERYLRKLAGRPARIIAGFSSQRKLVRLGPASRSLPAPLS